MLKSPLHNLLFLESLVFIRAEGLPAGLCECVSVDMCVYVCVSDTERLEQTCLSPCLCFSTHSLHFPSPQAFPVPSVAGRQMAPLLTASSPPSCLGELIFRESDLCASSVCLYAKESGLSGTMKEEGKSCQGAHRRVWNNLGAVCAKGSGKK